MVAFEDNKLGTLFNGAVQVGVLLLRKLKNLRCLEKCLRIKIKVNRAQMLLIGLLLGVILGVLIIPHEQSCTTESVLFQPVLLPTRLVPASPSMVATELKNNSEITFRRPRYFSTELGLRKKLIAGVIVTRTVNNGILKELNRTLISRVDKLIFFVRDGEYLKYLKTAGASNVIQVGDSKTSVERTALKALKYLGMKFSEQFDHVYVVTDKFWINGRLLMETVMKLSVTDNFIMGVKQNSFCSLDHGTIISRRILKKLAASVDQCLTKIPAVASDTLGKCFNFVFHGSFQCDSSVQGLGYSTSSPDSSGTTIYKSVTVGPIKLVSEFFSVNTRALKYRLKMIESQIQEIQQNIAETLPKNPPKFQNITWPIGISRSYVPRTRFEVLKWNYWTNETVYGSQNKVSSALSGSERQDINNLMNSVDKHLITEHIDPAKLRLRNGYSRFDPVRGMEYIVDFKDQSNNSIRVEAVRPLSKMELVPMPFVTENKRLTILVPLRNEKLAQVRGFLDRFADFSTDRKSNTVLIFLILVRKVPLSGELGQGDIEDIKKLISKFNGKLTKSHTDNGIRAGYLVAPLKTTHSSALLTSVETVIKRLVGATALILTADVNLSLKDDFLNRVRMNTILNYQVFSPIPFVEYNPSVYGGKAKGRVGYDFEVTKNSGYFEHAIARFVSFYAADYLTAYKSLNGTIRKELEDYADFSSVIHLFVKMTPLHVFRAAEPSLKVPFCFPTGCSSFETCVRTMWASRSQLAAFILQSEGHAI